jgi:transglutaminase-like putative cysteine protease
MKRLAIIAMITGFLTITLAAQTTTATKTGSDIIKRKIEFNYGGYTFKDELSFKSSDYMYYKRLGKKQMIPAYQQLLTENRGHAYFMELATKLQEDAKALGYSGQELVEYLTAFVQSIPYKEDPQNDGYDYPRYPIETIVDGGGDCEDKSALLVSLLNSFGFDAIMISPPGHMAAAVQCENCDEGTYEVNGKKYVYIETTMNGWQIGMVPPEFAKYSALDVYGPQ